VPPRSRCSLINWIYQWYKPEGAAAQDLIRNIPSVVLELHSRGRDGLAASLGRRKNIERANRLEQNSQELLRSATISASRRRKLYMEFHPACA